MDEAPETDECRSKLSVPIHLVVLGRFRQIRNGLNRGDGPGNEVSRDHGSLLLPALDPWRRPSRLRPASLPPTSDRTRVLASPALPMSPLLVSDDANKKAPPPTDDFHESIHTLGRGDPCPVIAA